MRETRDRDKWEKLDAPVTLGGQLEVLQGAAGLKEEAGAEEK